MENEAIKTVNAKAILVSAVNQILQATGMSATALLGVFATVENDLKDQAQMELMNELNKQMQEMQAKMESAENETQAE